jgi:hypothetical protein
MLIRSAAQNWLVARDYPQSPGDYPQSLPGMVKRSLRQIPSVFIMECKWNAFYGTVAHGAQWFGAAIAKLTGSGGQED